MLILIANALDSADDLLTDNLKHSSSPINTELYDESDPQSPGLTSPAPNAKVADSGVLKGCSNTLRVHPEPGGTHQSGHRMALQIA